MREFWADHLAGRGFATRVADEHGADSIIMLYNSTMSWPVWPQGSSEQVLTNSFLRKFVARVSRRPSRRTRPDT